MIYRKLVVLLILTTFITTCRADSTPSSQQVQATPPPTQTAPIIQPSSPEPALPTPIITPVSPIEAEDTMTYTIQEVNQSTGFTTYQAVPISIEPGVPAYPTTLASLTNNQAASVLNPAQQKTLEENGFVVTPAPFAQIYQIYQDATKQGQPVFVTTDALLHTYHVLIDFALRDAEINHFVNDLTLLTAKMLNESEAQIENTSGDAQQAAVRNLAYFSVAASLLDPTFTPSSNVSDLVAAELALIQGQAGFQLSPIFEYEEDYSQYVPRGHYTRNETFKRYFQAMMWYGRVGFRLRPGNQPEQIELGQIQTRQAILIAAMLGSVKIDDKPAIETWERIYEPTTFFVGKGDDLTVYDYLPLIRNIYSDTFNPQTLNDTSRLNNFIQLAIDLRPPRIIGDFVTDQEDPAAVTKSFRFMGQRFVPDAYVFQQLVYDKVGSLQNPRFMPSGLDLAAVLGSKQAYNISLNVYNQGEFENYTDQIAALQTEFANLPPEQWVENLYWGRLYTLQPLLSAPGEGYPIFMQNPAWVDNDLHTYLSSWAELKHDTILYAKQSTSMVATGIESEPVQVNGYVEPRPAVFARLAAMVNQTRQGLSERDLLNGELNDKFMQFESLLLALLEMTRKELTNQNLTVAEQEQIREIGDTLEKLATFSDQTQAGLASEADRHLAIIADVHTDPNSKQVLEGAIGDAFIIWVIAPVDGKTTLTQGGVYSYYEFLWPMNNRLTDEMWQSTQPKPERPVWTASFIVP